MFKGDIVIDFMLELVFQNYKVNAPNYSNDPFLTLIF